MPLCGNCFCESNAAGPCPVCGYDGRGAAEQYPLALKPGAILNGRYTVGRVLGQGGFGITYLAQDYRTKERVAIKEYLPTELAGRGRDEVSVQTYARERAEDFAYGKAQFLEEAKTLADVGGNEHVVRVYNYFEENGTAYFTMEFVQGPALNRYMAMFGGRLGMREAKHLLLPLMRALSKVHAKGVVHRDIAPDNIIITGDGVAKLIDFGAARYSTGEKSKSLDVILKHGFAPYEQYMRRGRQGPWTDVYAMAATFYYAITGRVPPEAVERMESDTLVPPSRMGAAINLSDEQALLKALSVSAANRFHSMDEFCAALSGDPAPAPPSMADNARPVQPRPAPAAPQPKAAASARRTGGKKRAPLPLILGSVLTLALALVIFGVIKLTWQQGTAKKWTFDASTGVLTISGHGDMADYSQEQPPWYELRDKIQTVKIRKGVTGIGSKAFSYCSNLSSIAIPDSVTRIGDKAFYYCSSLSGISIPGSVTDIGDEAFYCCRKLSSVTISDSVSRIGNRAFYSCTKLSHITIPNSVTSIGFYAFGSCTSLTSVTISDSVTGIKDSVFSSCRSLASVTIPNSVTSIGFNAFNGCSGLTSITIPDSVTSIEKVAFGSCEKLTDVYYGGTEAQWAAIQVSDGNGCLTSATIHFGS